MTAEPKAADNQEGSETTHKRYGVVGEKHGGNHHGTYRLDIKIVICGYCPENVHNPGPKHICTHRTYQPEEQKIAEHFGNQQLRKRGNRLRRYHPEWQSRDETIEKRFAGNELGRIGNIDLAQHHGINSPRTSRAKCQQITYRGAQGIRGIGLGDL